MYLIVVIFAVDLVSISLIVCPRDPVLTPWTGTWLLTPMSGFSMCPVLHTGLNGRPILMPRGLMTGVCLALSPVGLATSSACASSGTLILVGRVSSAAT